MERTVSIEELLAQARGDIDRLTPAEALAEQRAGALVVDIRPLEQRQRDGCIPQAVVIDRNVLEWRLAPTSRWRLPEASERRIVLICNQGYQSSLAAHTLRQLGLVSVAEVEGGFEAWNAAGLPVVAWGGAGG